MHYKFYIFKKLKKIEINWDRWCLRSNGHDNQRKNPKTLSKPELVQRLPESPPWSVFCALSGSSPSLAGHLHVHPASRLLLFSLSRSLLLLTFSCLPSLSVQLLGLFLLEGRPVDMVVVLLVLQRRRRWGRRRGWWVIGRRMRMRRSSWRWTRWWRCSRCRVALTTSYPGRTSRRGRAWGLVSGKFWSLFENFFFWSNVCVRLLKI